MLRKTLFLACAALLLSLATSSEAKAWFVYHYGGGYPYVALTEAPTAAITTAAMLVVIATVTFVVGKADTFFICVGSGY